MLKIKNNFRYIRNYISTGIVREYLLMISVFLILYGSIGFIPRNYLRATFCIILCLIAVAIALCCSKVKINLSSVIIYGILTLLCIVNYFVAHESLKIALHSILGGFLMLCFVQLVDLETFKRIFTKVIVFTSAYAVIAYILYSIFPELITIFPRVVTAQNKVYDLFFTVIYDTGFTLRLYGFAWEPGAYQTFLNIAFIIVLFEKNINIKYIITLLLALFLTFSTTAYIGTAMILVAFGISKLKNVRVYFKHVNFKHVLIAISSIMVVLITLYLLMPEFFFGITSGFNKIKTIFMGVSTKDNISSASVRVDSVYYPFKLFLKNPLFGAGCVGMESLNNVMLHTMKTCTPINYFAMYGVFYGVIAMACFYCFVKKLSGKTLWGTLMLFLSFMVLVISEDYVNYTIMTLFMLYGSTEIFKRKKKANT